MSGVAEMGLLSSLESSCCLGGCQHLWGPKKAGMLDRLKKKKCAVASLSRLCRTTCSWRMQMHLSVEPSWGRCFEAVWHAEFEETPGASVLLMHICIYKDQKVMLRRLE